MDKSKIRRILSKCFVDVFGAEIKDAVHEATMDNTPSWDSVETWRLAMSIEEEFKIKINLERFSELNSFAAFENYLVDRIGD